MKFGNGWQLLPKRTKILFVVAVGAIVSVFLAAGIITVFSDGGDHKSMVSVKGLNGSQSVDVPNEEKGKSGGQTSDQTVQPTPPESQINESENSVEEQITFSDFTLEFDENGMVIMPVTTDPKAVALAAASSMFASNFTLEADEYFDIAVDRMTQPTESYIGPEGEIHTYWYAMIRHEQWYDTPKESIMRHLKRERAHEDYKFDYHHPWRFAKLSIYEHAYNYAKSMPDGLRWIPKPYEIFGEDELTDKQKHAILRFPSAVDMEPDTPGATVSFWFVNLEAEGSEIGISAPLDGKPYMNKHIVPLAIWCDAPEDGGICGVAFIFPEKYTHYWN